jgi:hypothetical protein
MFALEGGLKRCAGAHCRCVPSCVEIALHAIYYIVCLLPAGPAAEKPRNAQGILFNKG